MRLALAVAAAVFLPAGATAATLMEEMAETGRFDRFLSGVEAAGLSGHLEGPGPVTVLAPTDEAYAAAATEDLAGDAEAVRRLLLTHFVEGDRYLADNLPRTMAAASGDTITVRWSEGVLSARVDGGPPWAEAPRIGAGDIRADNGIAHPLSGILAPRAEAPPLARGRDGEGREAAEELTAALGAEMRGEGPDATVVVEDLDVVVRPGPDGEAPAEVTATVPREDEDEGAALARPAGEAALAAQAPVPDAADATAPGGQAPVTGADEAPASADRQQQPADTTDIADTPLQSREQQLVDAGRPAADAGPDAAATTDGEGPAGDVEALPAQDAPGQEAGRQDAAAPPVEAADAEPDADGAADDEAPLDLAGAIEGWAVTGAEGKAIGEIETVLRDEVSGRVEGVLVKTRGFLGLGIGGRVVRLEPDEISLRPDREEVLASLTRKEARGREAAEAPPPS